MYAKGFQAPNLPGLGVALDSWASTINQRESFHKKSNISSPYARQNYSELNSPLDIPNKSSRPSTAGFLRPKPHTQFTTSQQPSLSVEPPIIPDSDSQSNVPSSSLDRRRPQSAGPILRTQNQFSPFYTPQPPVQRIPTGNFFNPISPQTQPQSTSTFLPQFVLKDRLVCRFFGHFAQSRHWDPESLHQTPIETHIFRKLNIYFYLEDETIELFEHKLPNSGFSGGVFYKRGVLKTISGELVRLQDLAVGRELEVLGQRIQITDADAFTRDYFQRELNIALPPALDQPTLMREDLGAQFATGLCPSSTIIAPRSTNHGNCSPSYPVQRKAVEKTWRFLNYDGCVLRYQIIDINDLEKEEASRVLFEGQTQGRCRSVQVPPNIQKYALYFYLSDSSLEIRAIKNRESSVGMDDDSAHLLLKKTKIIKNWRQVRAHGPTSTHSSEPQYVEPPDLLCGGILDVYGRRFLLLKVDDFTRDMYRELGLNQEDLSLRVKEISRIEQPIPELGDNNLAIGSPEDTLLTVYGAKRPATASQGHKKVVQNLNRMLRCKIVMCTQNRINASRIFYLTYNLQDDSIQIYEEVLRNSGVMGGTYLKRGRYSNDLTATADSKPRYFVPQDIFLGNIISINGVRMRITELDSMSIKFCESIPGDFPMFDVFAVSLSLYPRLRPALRARGSFLTFSSSPSGLVDESGLNRLFESLSLSSLLNQQELLTLTRSLHIGKQSAPLCYCIPLFVDILSQSACLLSSRGSTETGKYQFLRLCRQTKTLWRRDFQDHPLSGICTLSSGLSVPALSLSALSSTLKKHGVSLSQPLLRLLSSEYSLNRTASSPSSPSFSFTFTSRQSLGSSGEGQRVRADLKSKSRLQSSLLVEPSPSESLKLKASSSKSHLDTQQTLSEMIDFGALCDDIYPADWE